VCCRPQPAVQPKDFRAEVQSLATRFRLCRVRVDGPLLSPDGVAHSLAVVEVTTVASAGVVLPILADRCEVTLCSA